MKPFLSIVTPTLNEEKYLPNLLEDLVKQKKKNFEVIVIDGKSSDKTLHVIEKFKEKLDIQEFVVNKRDVVFQKNFGAKKAKGEYLVFIDADSRVYSTMTQSLEKEISKSKYMIYLPAMVPQGGTYTDKTILKFGNFLVEMSQTWPKPMITIGMMIFNRKFFNHIGGYKIKSKGKGNMVSEDHDIVLRGVKSGVHPKFLKKIKVRFSLRRVKKEGRFNVMRKYFISAYEMTVKGKREAQLDYEMGGHVYDLPKKNGNQAEFWKKLRVFAKKSKRKPSF